MSVVPSARLATCPRRGNILLMPSPVDQLARCLVLGSLLDELTTRFDTYDLVAHWKQGEFHHDLVLKLPEAAKTSFGGSVLVVATNCNGGIKEVLCFTEVPSRGALWHHRCPSNDDFEGELPAIISRATTEHWFDPCDLLVADARSELRPEYRQRQDGGGWEHADAPNRVRCRG
jgi:hypothetical protein